MYAPLSWLKEYVDIRLSTKELAQKLTTVGLGCEKIIKDGSDEIFELEITPNRPDWLSILGIAREIAALENKKIRYSTFSIPKPKTFLPIDIKLIYEVSPRTSALIIKNAKAKASPEFISERIKKIGLRPINNLVDISNYVMFETGNPIHIFDYDKIDGHKLEMILSSGNEEIVTLDDLKYKLPPQTILFKDARKIIDLCGIKGGKNSAVDDKTQNILILVAIYDGVHVRKTSKALSLRSDASAIFERGANTGGTIQTLQRVTQLVLEHAGGEVASDIIDHKINDFLPWTINLRLDFTEKLLGIKIPVSKIIEIFESLELKVLKKTDNIIKVEIPTVRGDLKLEEDLIEEVARLYDYNNFPKTMPEGIIPTTKIPYYNDYKIENFIKTFLVSAGFTEICSYSLEKNGEIKLNNPVSSDFSWLRSSLYPSLQNAIKENKVNYENISLFEVGKIYKTGLIEESKVAAIINRDNYFYLKGIVEELLNRMHINSKEQIIDELTQNYFCLSLDEIKKRANLITPYRKISPYPPIIEDLSVMGGAKTSEIIDSIYNQSKLIVKVEMLDRYQDSRTFRITYQSNLKSLTDNEVSEIRESIINILQIKLKLRIRGKS